MRRTVLVADDSATIQKRASGILTGEGMSVVTVSNGVAAIKKLSAVNPLVVLADVAMPGKDGYEVCQFIKQSPALKHVSVLLVFSDTEPYEESRGAQVGADGRIKKPFNQDELVQVVTRMAAQSEAAVAPPAPVALPPPPPVETFSVEPMDAEPVEEVRNEPQASAFSSGVAFGDFSPADADAAPVVASEPVIETVEASPAAAGAATSASLPPEVHEPAPEVEPELVEETIISQEEPHVHPHPHEHEHEGFFHAPEVLPEPSLVDEVEAVPAEGPATTEAAFSPEPEPVPPPSPETFAAVAEAPAAPPEEAVPAEPDAAAVAVPEPAAAQIEPPTVAAEPGPAPVGAVSSEPGAAPAPARLDAEQVHTIVRKVVAKMSPPALPTHTIEDIARKLADDILAESSF